MRERKQSKRSEVREDASYVARFDMEEGNHVPKDVGSHWRLERPRNWILPWSLLKDHSPGGSF